MSLCKSGSGPACGRYDEHRDVSTSRPSSRITVAMAASAARRPIWPAARGSELPTQKTAWNDRRQPRWCSPSQAHRTADSPRRARGKGAVRDPPSRH
jgi:hypothetical protein